MRFQRVRYISLRSPNRLSIVEKGNQEKTPHQLHAACEKNRKLIRRSRKLIAAIDERLCRLPPKGGVGS